MVSHTRKVLKLNFDGSVGGSPGWDSTSGMLFSVLGTVGFVSVDNVETRAILIGLQETR